MKKFLLLVLAAGIVSTSFSQDSTKRTAGVPALKRPNDHFMLQYGYTGLTGRPDSVRTGGFSRFFNAYFMLNKPFKTSPKMSVAFGLGIGSNNFFFDNVNVDIKAVKTRLPFTIADSMNHYKKFKVTNINLELPIELRWFSNPNDPDHSYKFAIGAKVGTLLKAYSKGKDLVSKSGVTQYDTRYIQKEYSKRFFNGTTLAVSARVGYSHFSLMGQYNITAWLKENAGAQMRPYNIGITVSGL